VSHTSLIPSPSLHANYHFIASKNGMRFIKIKNSEVKVSNHKFIVLTQALTYLKI